MTTRKKPKFRCEEVVVPQEEENGSLVDDRPIKLYGHEFYNNEMYWRDTWGNTYPERLLRPLTAQEKGRSGR